MARRSCNVLVIGGGLAGVQAAEGAAQFVSGVLLVERDAIGEASATLHDASMLAAYLAQDAGGVSDWKSTRVSLSVQAPGTATPAADATAIQRGYHAYLRDIASHGGDLVDPQLADFTAAGVYNRIGWLESYGLHVVRDDTTRAYRSFPSPGHTLGRVLLLEEPAREVLEKIRKSATVFGASFADGLHVTRILIDGGRVAGAYALDVRSGEPVVIESTAVILAAGGADRLYRAGAPATAGAGYQLALEAGAELANMEFVAFGPEATRESQLPSGILLILVGLGATLQHDDGAPIAGSVESVADLVQTLARAARRGRVQLRVPPDVLKTIAGVPPLRPYLSMPERPVEVGVGSRGLLGGVVHHAFATGVEGLFVAGAVATGCHGADLLAGVDTSFALYSAENAATAAATYWSHAKPARLPDHAVHAEETRLAAMRSRPRQASEVQRAALEESIRRIMWEHVGPGRAASGLREALDRLGDVRRTLESQGAGTGAELVALCDLDGLVATASLVCEAALAREESRGQHVRADFPARDDMNGRSWITIVRRDGALTWKRIPVPGD